jgi:tetratricopeptide (TPR) repeat protein
MPVKSGIPGTRTLIWILAVTSLLLYINTLQNGYVLDDLAVIKANTYVNKGISSIPKLLTTPYLKGFRREADTAASNDLYRPLSLVMFAAEQQIAPDTPAIGHFMNVVIFAGCVVLLFLLLDRLFEGKRKMAAFLAALLFAVHPIHTEVVANIKSRDELLCFFFAFASLLLYTSYVRSGRAIHLAAGAALYFLSLLSKETSTSFLIVIPLIFFFYLNDEKRRSINITLASVGTFLVYLAIRYAVLIAWNANHLRIIDLMENELIGAPSAAAKYGTALLVLGHYIKLLFIPYPLSSDYAFKTIPFVTFSSLWVWVTILVYVALKLTGLIRLLKNKKDPYAFGILFFLFTIALFANILFLTGAVMAERFLFFPSVGFCLIIALLLVEFVPRILPGAEKIFTSPGMWYVAGPIVLLFSVLTISRNRDWKDNYTLFRTDVHKYPANARLWYSLGFEIDNTIIQEEPDTERKIELMKESIKAMQHSVTIYPNYSMAHNDLGNLFVRIKAFDSAEVHLKKAVALNGKDPVNITDLGGLYYTEGNYAQAATLCKQALLIEPRNTEILNNVALSYFQLKQTDSAALYAGKALQVNPQNELAAQILAAIKKGTNTN